MDRNSVANVPGLEWTECEQGGGEGYRMGSALGVAREERAGEKTVLAWWGWPIRGCCACPGAVPLSDRLDNKH